MQFFQSAQEHRTGNLFVLAFIALMLVSCASSNKSPRENCLSNAATVKFFCHMGCLDKDVSTGCNGNCLANNQNDVNNCAALSDQIPQSK